MNLPPSEFKPPSLEGHPGIGPDLEKRESFSTKNRKQRGKTS
jgi:hypothetical protein